jgi:hypothetical protein
LTLSTTWRHIGGVAVQPHSFLISTLKRGEWLTSCSSPLNPWEELRYPLNIMLGGPLSRYGNFREDKNLLPPPRFKTPARQPRNPIVISTTLACYPSWGFPLSYCPPPSHSCEYQYCGVPGCDTVCSGRRPTHRRSGQTCWHLFTKRG